MGVVCHHHGTTQPNGCWHLQFLATTLGPPLWQESRQSCHQTHGSESHQESHQTRGLESEQKSRLWRGHRHRILRHPESLGQPIKRGDAPSCPTEHATKRQRCTTHKCKCLVVPRRRRLRPRLQEGEGILGDVLKFLGLDFLL